MNAAIRMLAITAVGVALIARANFIAARPLLIWNATASMPVGLYRVATARDLRVGEYVLLRPDLDSARLFAARGYLPIGVPLLKRIGAVAGQVVCEQDGRVSIDGLHIADAREHDGRGRPLRAWSGCHWLAADELFVLVPDIRASLDGRYFGPSPVSSVIGRAIPIWMLGGRR